MVTVDVVMMCVYVRVLQSDEDKLMILLFEYLPSGVIVTLNIIIPYLLQ